MSKKQKPKYTSIGGQALMEGIMMRGPEKTVMCVRRADGSIVTENVKQGKKRFWNKIPIVRGVAAFIESMIIGTKTLMRSAELAIEDELKAVEDEEAKAAEGSTLEAAKAPAEATESAGEEVAAAETTDSEAAPTTAEEADTADVATDSAEAAKAGDDAIPTSVETPAPAAVSDTVSAPADGIAEPAVDKSAPAAMQDAADGKKAKKTKAKKDVKPEKKADEDSGFLMFIATVLGFGLAILLFFYAPTWVAGGLLDWVFPRILPENWSNYFADATVQQVWRPIIEGVVKLIIFLVYMLICSSMKEIRTLFMYHGAEHKTIFCYESGEELTVENVRKFKRFHPRCGTSFLILMLLIGIVAGIFVKFSALPDAIKNSPIYYPLIKIALIPLIMGVGYELLKLAGKYDNIFTRIISAPGLWFQRITTREPNDAQIECAIAALKPVIPADGRDMQ